MYLAGFAVLLCGTVNAVTIQSTGAVANQVAYAGATEPTNLIDPTQTSGTQLYMPAWADVYLSNEWGTEHHWIYIDLGATYDLDTIRIWNYMHQETTLDVSGRGGKNISIHVGGTGAVLPTTGPVVGTNDTDGLLNAFLGTGWTKIFDSNIDGNLTRGPNTTTSVAGTLTNASLVLDASGAAGVRYIGIDFDSKWAADPYATYGVGLSYVQVEGTLIGIDPAYKATDPYPPNNAAGVPLNQVLSWIEPSGFTPSGYDVYFDSNELLVAAGDASVDVTATDVDGDLTNTYFVTPGDLLENTTYFWRLDALDGETVYEGDIWSFTSSVEPPETMRGTVVKLGTGEIRTLNLEKYSCRGDNFELVLLGTDGITKTTIDPGPVRTYRGWCEEEPDSYVEARLLKNGDLRYWVFKTDGSKNVTSDWLYYPPASATEGAAPVNNFTIIGGTANNPNGQPFAGASWTVPAAAYTTAPYDTYYTNVYQADVGFDLTVEYVNAINFSDPASYGLKAENAIMHMNGFSVRDILKEHKLGKVVIRQSRAVLEDDGYLQWTKINEYWADLFPDADHNFLAFIGQAGGGVAYVCNYGYYPAIPNWLAGKSFSDYMVTGYGWHGEIWGSWRHELGHNWGAHDCAGGCPSLDGPTINSGNAMTRFNGMNVDNIMYCQSLKFAGGEFLPKLGSYDYPVPPYAKIDQAETQIGEPIFLDVLGNDYDANNDMIAISSFDTTTTFGGTVEFSAGSGPDGRDQLVYFPQASVECIDTFRYNIVDSSGRVGGGNVSITLKQKNLRMYWPIDDGSGETVSEVTGYSYNGTLTSMDPNTAWVGGKFGGALEFDGVDERVVGSLQHWGGSVTFSVWVNFDASGSNTFRRVMSKGYYLWGWQLGLTAYTAGTYVTDGAEFSLQEDTTIVRSIGGTTSLTAGTWNHLVGVYDIDADMMYLYVNGELEASTAISPTSGGIRSHWDPTPLQLATAFDGYYFPGLIDEVRFYEYALDENDIGVLYEGGRAENPDPLNKAPGITIGKTLSWLPGAAAVEHDVYFGTDYNTVLNATTASDEYIGRQSETVYDPNLNCGTGYYWRVDEVMADESVIGGVVWEFTTDTLITPTVHDFSSQNPVGLDRYADHTVDGSGLTGDGSVGSTHAVGDEAISWTSVGSYAPTDDDPYITYDLGGICNVTTIREWGSNSSIGSIFGPDEVDIYTSTDGVVFTLATTVNFAQAPGVSGYGGNDIVVNLSDVRYIKLDFMTNHDGATFDGTGSNGGTDGRSLIQLHEIRFEGKPDMYDGSDGMDDLAGFMARWLDSECADLPACGSADLDGDLDVDLVDFSIFGFNWLSGL